MLLLRTIILLLVFAVVPARAAGLAGFSTGVPYSREEQILGAEFLPSSIINYREAMRDNVLMLADYAKENRKGFQVILHGGSELLAKGLWEFQLDTYEAAYKLGQDVDDPMFLAKIRQVSPERFTPQRRFIASVDGIALNNVFCGDDSEARPDLRGRKLIAVDWCRSGAAFDAAVEASAREKALLYAFADKAQAFQRIKGQAIIGENPRHIAAVKEASNISFLIDDSGYKSKAEMLDDIASSNYDIVVIEPLFHGVEPWLAGEVNGMKFKKLGARRLVLAAQNISEARDGAYYWRKGWDASKDGMLARLSLVDKDSFIARYWRKDWKAIVSNYFKGIVDTGFDGAFLTGLENHYYFEKLTPLE